MKKTSILPTIAKLCSKTCRMKLLSLPAQLSLPAKPSPSMARNIPMVKLEITNASHPFFTGKQKLVDTAGRVDKFMSRYGNRGKK